MINESKYAEALDLYKAANLKRVDLCRQLGIDYNAFTYFLKSRHPELINAQNSRKNSDYAKEQRKDTAKRYSQALKLAQTTTLSYSDIARETGVSVTGFRTFIQKHHRDLMMQRKGITASKRGAANLRIRKKDTGQSVPAHEKYKEAIEACDNIENIELTIYQIAQNYQLRPSSLLYQLRTHYPDIITRREHLREKKGLADNHPKGVRDRTVKQYEEAINLLETSDSTIEEVAAACRVSFAGLRTYLFAYRKDIAEKRRRRKS